MSIGGMSGQRRPERFYPARVQRLTLPADRRILVISDVHGNLDYLRGLLQKAQYDPARDVLMLLGDLLEKGTQSLATLRFVLGLRRRGAAVYMVSGNCDWWPAILYGVGTEAGNLWYFNHKPHCLARQMCAECGIPVSPEMDYAAMRDAIVAAFPEEFNFLAALPQVIETADYVFVHGGLPAGAETDWDAWHCMKHDRFLETPQRFDRWVIAGHWPVVLYHERIVDANPVFDREKRIISIDGGCVLKDDGQLNALIIPRAGSEDFSVIAYDPFPTATVAEDQAGGGESYYIRWGDARVRVLVRGAEFSRVRHLRTGYEMEVLTKYLLGAGEECTVNDCTDYVLPLRAGDEVSVVETSSRGYFVKHKGVSGWYFGALK